MRASLGKYALAVLLTGSVVLGVTGCSSQITHHSGQIGRYYGDGVSFSVPVVQRAAEVQQEDKFWEVRQGIGGADVVVLGPFVTQDGGESFRENMVLSSRAVDVSDAEQFRRQQLAVLKNDIPSAVAVAEGQDETGLWADYECEEKGRVLACRAYFFLDAERSLGYVLVGTVLKSPKTEEYRQDFGDIAKTFRIGTPLTACECMSEVLAKAVGGTTELPAAASEAPTAASAGPNTVETPAAQGEAPAAQAETPTVQAEAPAPQANAPAAQDNTAKP